MKFTPFCISLVVCAGMGGLASGADTAPRGDHSLQGDDFSGKFVMVFLDAEARSPSFILSEAEIKEIGGRTFLVGRNAYTWRESKWWEGKATRVSWQLVPPTY